MLCLIFSTFWSVLEDQSRKLFAVTYVVFYSIERFIVLSLAPALGLFFPPFSYVMLFISFCVFLLCLALSICVFLCIFICCLCVSRCFGLLLSPGKNVKNSDMHLLDLVGGFVFMFVSVAVHCVFFC